MKNIWFIRHGESEANAGLVTSDPSTIQLTRKGMDQSILLADHFKEQPDLIIVSSYIRTQQTSDPLREKFPNVAVEVWPLHEFDYLCPELCRNSTAETRKPLVTDYWLRCSETYIHGPGAETFSDFKTRVVGQIQRLRERPEKYIVIFTHGQVMRAIWQYLHEQDQNVSMEFFRDKMLQFKIDNTSILSFSWDEKTGWVKREHYNPE